MAESKSGRDPVRDGRKKNRGKNWKNSRRGKPRNKIKAPPVTCYVCGKHIESVSQSIGGKNPDEFAHFDCVLREIAEQENIEPGQKISYVGNGDFAVVEYSRKNFSGGFTIVRRIPFEDQKIRNSVKKMVAERKYTARV